MFIWQSVDGGGYSKVAVDIYSIMCVCVGLQRRSGLDSDFPLRSRFQGEKVVWRRRGGKEGKEREKRGDEERRGTSGNDLCLLVSSHSKSVGFLAAAWVRTNGDACILRCLNTNHHQKYITL